MKGMIRLLLAAGVLAAVGCGCRGPRLTSRPLTGKETSWAYVVKRSYPGWRAPYFSPLDAPPAASAAVPRGGRYDGSAVYPPLPAAAPADTENVLFVPVE